jgi:hypothetical protein
VSGLAVGIVLAVAASIALNGSYLLQHAGAIGAAAVNPWRPLATLRALLRSPLWAAGALVGMTGWALHVGALARAPISIVQAFVAGGIALTVPMAALGCHHRVGPGERRGAALLAAGLVLLAVGLRDPGSAGAFEPGRLATYVAALALAAAAAAIAVTGPRRAAALGAAGGLLYGAADLAIKALTIVHHEHGLARALTSPWAAVALSATCGAFFAFQRGLQTGRPVTVIALMTAATNLVSIAGGFVVFGDPLGDTPALAALHVVAFVLIGVAAWRLAPSQAGVVGDH